MADKQAYQQKMEAQLDEWSAKIDVLKAKSEKASADAKIQYHQQIENLQNKKAKAQDKLRELKEASEGAFESLKDGIDSAWDDFKNSLEEALSKLN
jgi:hypothetical protein